MSVSSPNPYAKLAREGINILSATHRPEDAGVIYIFEYSWVDPEQASKLHWSKAPYFRDYANKNWVDDLIQKARSARKELEA